jgi:hypothetical protein
VDSKKKHFLADLADLPTNPQIHLECNAPARVLLKNNDIVYNYSPALGTSLKIYLKIYNN